VKKVHFIRHGQGFHNVAQAEWRAAGKPGEPYTLDTDPNLKYGDALLTPVSKAVSLLRWLDFHENKGLKQIQQLNVLWSSSLIG